MFEWISYHRSGIAAVVILGLVITLLWSIYHGVKTARIREKEQVFGDPERTTGGWYWAVCGVATILLLWFYYSWGMARAYFPKAANELCQIAKVHESLSPIVAQLPIGSRYFKSTDLVVRNNEQLDDIEASFPVDAFSAQEEKQIRGIITQTRSLIAVYSNPDSIEAATVSSLSMIVNDINGLTDRIKSGSAGLIPTEAALAQSPWGVTPEEIPMLPMTPRGVMFDGIAQDVTKISKEFLTLRNMPDAANQLIKNTRADIKLVKDNLENTSAGDDVIDIRQSYMKSVERVFKRLDDGMIFPANTLDDVNTSVAVMIDEINAAKGGLGIIDALFMPGAGVVKTRTICIEQGSSRWLPKPTDVIATFSTLANPNIEEGGGFKGTRLLWFKWLPISDVVGFFVPDSLVDILPGSYGKHDDVGRFVPTYKDHMLAFAKGEVYMGSIPMLDGHIWDSLFRVLVAMSFGIMLGVPLGIYMGVSRFFKSFFDPMIELYRPVPPLAWAPLILTIFGIQDDGKIFLLFMVAFAIMVISARTGASGTQLSKIRASHSLGASNRQILRHVILPNALPEILTGVRIAIGVCWGTLVAAEMLAGTTGVGFIENVARTVSDYELIWVTILIMGLLGLMFDLMMRKLISILIPWRGKG
ncbi:MAG: ABC transporter permease [Alphaproteobacteria bacterium]|nr:ABC transporter permease [Alphaproteobacteria bacterium]MDA8675750.1 ABC transporter permease [Alphaproteobacteria bacterium]